MITSIVWMKRKKGMSLQAFQEYWYERHVPLVLGTPEFVRHVRKYIQYHPAPGGTKPGELFGDRAEYDGVAELWFDSRDAMNAAFNEPMYLQNVRPDELEFVDLEGCLSFVAEARPIYREPGLMEPGFKAEEPG